MRILTQHLRRCLIGLLMAPALAVAADPQIASFTDSPDPVIAGGLYSYQVRVDNNAVDSATNTRLRLTLSGGAAFVSASPSSQNCSATSSTQVDCNLGTLIGSGSDTRTITITWRATAVGPATINATAEVFADNDVNSFNNAQVQDTTVLSGANLALAMSGSPTVVAPGGNVTYTLTPSNAGPNSAADLQVIDNLPPSSTFVSASGSGWSCSNAGSTVTCLRSGSHFANAAIPPITIVATANASSGTITNSATLSTAAGGVADPDTADNTVTTSTSIQSGSDVQVQAHVVTTPTPIVAGSVVAFRILPRNTGPDAGAGVVVSETLPTGWTAISASGTNWSCTAAGQNISCTRATMPVGAADDITVVANSPATAAPGGSTYTVTASITSTSSDPLTGNNSGSAFVTLFPDGADLSISKTKTPFAISVGATLTSTIRVTNAGPQAAVGTLRVVEVLSNESYTGFSGAGWACTNPSATVVVCDFAGANLPVGSSLADLVITTTSTAAGQAINTACTGNSVPSGVVGITASPPAAGDPNPTNDCATAASVAVATGGSADLAVGPVTTTTPTGGDTRMSSTESTATFTAIFRNLGTSPATGAFVNYLVPNFISGSTVVSSVTAVLSSTNGSTATFTCTRNGALGRCDQSGGQWLPGDELTLVVTVGRPIARTWGVDAMFRVDISNTAEFDLNLSNNTGESGLQVDPIADVEVTGKTVSPTTVLAGETSTYVISYRNNGPDSANDVSLTDTFSFLTSDGTTANPADPGVTVVSLSLSKPGAGCFLGGTSLGVGSVITPANNVVRCDHGFMAEGEAHSITLVVRPASQAANPTRIIRNTVTASTSSIESASGGDNGNNSKTTSLTALSNAIDLLVNKTDAVDPVPYSSAGSTFIDYRVRVTSNGPSFGTNVRITESMTPPAGKRVRFVCDTTGFASSTCNATSLCSATNVTSAAGTALPSFTCSVPAGNATTGPAIGELATGQSKDIFLRYQVLDQPTAAGDVFTGTTTVTSNENETLLANNSQTETTTTRNLIDMRVSKAPSVPSVSVTQPFNWIVTVENRGPGDSLQNDLTDTLPPGTTITGPITWSKVLPAGTGTCTATGLSVACALGRMNAGDVATVTIPVRMDTYPTGGLATNTATTDTSTAKTGAEDFPGGNNTGTATVTVSRSSLSGMVFEDRNRFATGAGTPQDNFIDPRLFPVTVRLTGTDLFGNPVDRTTVTDSTGVYTFTDVPPSDATGYTITETQPAGYANGPVDPPIPSTGGTYVRGGVSGNSSYTGVVLGAGVAAVDYNFPELRLATLSGTVYIDVNLSNAFDAGDTPIAGATVRLLNGATLAEVATTTTDASGAYSFTGLDPTINYTLEQPLPVTAGSLGNGPVTVGSIGGSPCSTCTAQRDTPSAGIDRITGILMANGFGGTGFNFGEIQVTAISGTVYVDRNANATLDPTPTDGRIGGVTLNLYAGLVCGGAPLATLTTDAAGTYSFNGLTAGLTYTVCQTQPSGYADGGVNTGTNATSGVANAITINALPVSGSGGNHFYERLGTVSGSVFVDGNNNGQRDGADLGIAGVTVTLTGSDVTGAAVNRSATTDGSGNFSFTDLLASNGSGYTLTQQLAQPIVGGVTTLNGRNTAGGIIGTGTPGTTTLPTAGVASAISGIVLGAGSQSLNNQFGEILPITIRGLVFSDANNNGVQNAPADVGLSGVTINLTGTDDLGAAVSRSTTTALDGSFSFADLRPGTYALTEPTQPAGTTNGLTVAGTTGGTATAVGTTPSAITGIVIATPGTTSTDNRFAEIPDSGVISGRVWFDANNDGIVDATESGISGQTIQLTGTAAGAPVSRTATTAADGSFSFAGLAPGTYTLTQPAQPSGTFNGRTVAGTAGGTATAASVVPSAISGIVLGVGASSASNNFGETSGATVSGRVWNDTNNNGVIDTGETGIGGVTINLTGTDDLGAAVSLTTTTAADGTWSFANLRPGTYTVTEPTQPTGTLNGRTLAGTAGGTATALGTLPSAISGIAVTAGQTVSNYRFGEIPPAALSGRVWLDANNNGVIEGTESGLSGVTVTLSGTNDLGAAVSLSTTTAADGSYSFANLRPGTYAVTEPTQPTGTSNGRTIAGTAGGSPTAVNTTPSAITSILLVAGQSSTGNNFGEITGAQISGRVFTDANNNGAVDSGETGITGVTITLSGTDDLGASISRTTTTAADGSWSFTELRPGTYAVTESGQPSGTLNGRTVAGTAGGTVTDPATVPSRISAITLVAAQVSSGNLFAEIPAAQLGGRVFADANNDGVFNSGEQGLASVTITLTGTDDLGAAVNLSRTTLADGSYQFTDLRPGTYAVTEPTQPPGTSNGLTVAGSAGGTATAVSVTPSAITGVALPVGATATAYNFAEVPDSADLVVRKSHTKSAFTVGLTGTYQISVRNSGSLPSSGSYTVADRLPTGLTLNATPTGTGWTCTGAGGDATFSCSSSTVLAAGAVHPGTISVVVNVGAAALPLSPVNNVVMVEGGGEVTARGPSQAERDAFLGNPAGLPACSATATQNACRDATVVQAAAAVAGTVWLDQGSTLKVLDSGDRRMAGWLVEVVDVATSSIVGRATTDARGAYRIAGLEPGVELAVRFRDPASRVVFGYPVNGETAPGSSGISCASGTPAAGTASSCPVAAPNPQLTVYLAPGADLTQQSLPIDPSGVVYDSVQRTAVPGATVVLAPSGSCTGWSPSTSVAGASLGGYTINGSSIAMTVGNDGLYQFLLTPSAPARCTFGLTVTPPSGYNFVSTAIAPASGTLSPTGAAGTTFAVQPQVTAPTGAVGAATTYYLSLSLGSSTASIVHNHIPLDPAGIGALSLTKTGDRSVAEVGDSVRYTLTISMASGGRPIQTSVVDRLPAGFTYIPGTATVNDVPIADPAGGPGPTLVFNLGTMPTSLQYVLRYRVRVGVGAMQGDGVNRAQGHACTLASGCVDANRNPIPTSVPTNRAEFRVRVMGGVFTTDACVLGKVFVDCNGNHIQDSEELGIPGVRLVLSDGTTLISDSEGKYSMCGLAPRSHVLRIDPSTLPRGSRLTTSSNRNLGDAGSLWLDLKNGELHRADFVEGSCSNTVLEQTKARRAQGEVRSVETEKKGQPVLRFDSKAHQLDTLRSPQQGTDGANQQAPKARVPSAAPQKPAQDESHVPTPNLPMNAPPPSGRSPGDAPDSAKTPGAPANGGSNG